MALLIIKLAYLMLPAYFANMLPPFGQWINGFNTPIDFNKKFHDKPILGPHKTFKGLFIGVISAILASYIQFRLNISWLNLIDYNNWLLWGFLLGFGSLFGDAVKSFFKRRLSIPSGKSWILFDQLDFAIGAIVFGSFVYFPGWFESLILLLIAFFGHLFFSWIGFLIGVKKSRI